MVLADIYFWGMVIGFSLIVVHLIFPIFDLLEGVIEPINWFISFTFFCNTAWVLTKYTTFELNIVLLLSTLSAVILFIVCKMYVIKYLKKTESSMSQNESSYEGNLGEVITSLNDTSFGEISVVVGMQRVNFPAKIYNPKENDLLEVGDQAVVIEIKEGIAYIAKFE